MEHFDKFEMSLPFGTDLTKTFKWRTGYMEVSGQPYEKVIKQIAIIVSGQYGTNVNFRLYNEKTKKSYFYSGNAFLFSTVSHKGIQIGQDSYITGLTYSTERDIDVDKFWIDSRHK